MSVACQSCPCWLGGWQEGQSCAAPAALSAYHPQVRWRRVILDEAHCIKDRRCNTAQAVFALQAK
jgi:hypothetical protein